MDWEQVRVFLEVARAGQILQASKHLRLHGRDIRPGRPEPVVYPFR